MEGTRWGREGECAAQELQTSPQDDALTSRVQGGRQPKDPLQVQGLSCVCALHVAATTPCVWDCNGWSEATAGAVDLLTLQQAQHEFCGQRAIPD